MLIKKRFEIRERFIKTPQWSLQQNSLICRKTRAEKINSVSVSG